MDSFYLFGAGVNCKSVIRFFEKSSIIAIIDNNESLYGNNDEGYPIISVDEYIENGDDKAILVTPYYVGESIVSDLEAKGVVNTYRAPWMQNKFFTNRQKLADYIMGLGSSNISFYEHDPISLYLKEELEERHLNIYYCDKYYNDYNMPHDTVIIVLTMVDENEKKCIKSEFKEYEILFIDEVVKQNDISKGLLKYKNIHCNERCFIVGNGPSLRVDDLNALRESNELCFGVNRVFLGFDETEWRPDYYVTVDEKLARDGLQGMRRCKCPKFVRKIYGVTSYLSDVELFEPLVQPLEGTGFSDEIERGIYMGHTVVYEAIQIAVYMGFSEIYLIGVDMSTGINYQDEGAHFYKTPDRNENLGVGNQIKAIECIGYAYRHLRGKGILLYNATRNAWWNDVPQVDFDALIG